jgi:hypothetical protein
MVDYYKYVVDALKKGKIVLWRYGLMGVAEIIRVTPTKRLSISDIQDNRFYLTRKQFNDYNKGTRIKDIIKIK